MTKIRDDKITTSTPKKNNPDPTIKKSTAKSYGTVDPMSASMGQGDAL